MNKYQYFILILFLSLAQFNVNAQEEMVSNFLIISKIEKIPIDYHLMSIQEAYKFQKLILQQLNKQQVVVGYDFKIDVQGEITSGQFFQNPEILQKILTKTTFKDEEKQEKYVDFIDIDNISPIKNIRLIPNSQQIQIPSNYHLMSIKEAYQYQQEINQQLQYWSIAAGYNFKIDGDGYGNNIICGSFLSDQYVDSIIVIENDLQYRDIKMVPKTSPIPQGYHFMDVDEAYKYKEFITDKLKDWDIYAGYNFKIDGRKYGFKITRNSHIQDSYLGSIIVIRDYDKNSQKYEYFQQQKILIIPKSTSIPENFHLMEIEEAFQHKEQISSLISEWEIVVGSGFKLDGQGYGFTIRIGDYIEEPYISQQIIIENQLDSNLILITTKQYLPNGYHVMDIGEAQKYKDYINVQLADWSIVAGQNFKIDGFGYGNNITNGDFLDEWYIQEKIAIRD